MRLLCPKSLKELFGYLHLYRLVLAVVEIARARDLVNIFISLIPL